MTASSPADFYLNQQQFSEMKLGARNQSSETTKAVAEQFESLFVQQMLASMRSAATIDESRHSSTVDFYQDMYDKQLALSISKQGGLGIAKVLMTQLPGGSQTEGNPIAPESGKGGKQLPVDRVPQLTSLTVVNEQPVPIEKTLVPNLYQQPSYQTQNPAVKLSKFQTDDLQVNKAQPQAQNEIGSEQRWLKPAHFVSDLWPHAEQAANAIGVSTEALVAQSALETGWGKHTMRFPDGKPAFNLFGIKAGSSWSGATLAKPTIEFQDGVMQTEMAHFRAYDSISDALDDYVNFIQSSPRYQDALDHEGSDTHYLNELQQGGYATDPRYADKIINIMQGKTLTHSLANLDANQSPVKENKHA